MSAVIQPPWYRQLWPWLLIAPPAVAVLAGVVTVVLAVRSDDGVVADDYYKRGLAVNAEIDRSRRAAELGLAAEVTAGNDGEIRITLQSALPLPAESVVKLRLVHPGRPLADRIALLARVQADVDQQTASYSGRFAGDASAGQVTLGSVAWRVVVETPHWRLDSAIAAGEWGRFRLTAAR
jgi:uncharacterized protein